MNNLLAGLVTSPKIIQRAMLSLILPYVNMPLRETKICLRRNAFLRAGCPNYPDIWGEHGIPSSQRYASTEQKE
jgi:hypothetical protein